MVVGFLGPFSVFGALNSSDRFRILRGVGFVGSFFKFLGSVGCVGPFSDLLGHWVRIIVFGF